jgi:hypothetical protein
VSRWLIFETDVDAASILTAQIVVAESELRSQCARDCQVVSDCIED